MASPEQPPKITVSEKKKKKRSKLYRDRKPIQKPETSPKKKEPVVAKRKSHIEGAKEAGKKRELLGLKRKVALGAVSLLAFMGYSASKESEALKFAHKRVATMQNEVNSMHDQMFHLREQVKELQEEKTELQEHVDSFVEQQREQAQRSLHSALEGAPNDEAAPANESEDRFQQELIERCQPWLQAFDHLGLDAPLRLGENKVGVRSPIDQVGVYLGDEHIGDIFASVFEGEFSEAEFIGKVRWLIHIKYQIPYPDKPNFQPNISEEAKRVISEAGWEGFQGEKFNFGKWSAELTPDTGEIEVFVANNHLLVVTTDTDREVSALDIDLSEDIDDPSSYRMTSVRDETGFKNAIHYGGSDK